MKLYDMNHYEISVELVSTLDINYDMFPHEILWGYEKNYVYDKLFLSF